MPQAPYLPLKMQPGAWRNGTRYEAFGRWYDVNMVRWTNGRLRPIGGWQRFSTSALSAPARCMHAWRANNFSRWLAIGTAAGLMVHDNTALQDVTPGGFVIGRTNTIYGLGWGTGKYGMDAYGTQRPLPPIEQNPNAGVLLDAATWTLDNFGEDLVGCCSGDGYIYRWSPGQASLSNGAEKAQRLVNAPQGVTAVFVTEERALVALGAHDNPRKVSWSSRENLDDWVSTALNTAGDLDAQTPGKLLAGVRWHKQSLLFTDIDAHLMSYEGTPLIYGISQIADASGLAGAGAVVSTGERVAWMSNTAFWQYDGVAKQVPCEVQDYVFRDINILQGAKITAGHNSQFNEIWWMYPSANSVENDRIVIWNYAEGWWSLGQIARTAWVDRGVWPHAVACDPAGNLYQHEDGWTASGVTRVGQVWAESGAIEMGRGERFVEVRQLIPDAMDDPSACALSFNLRENPQSAPFAVAGPFLFEQSNGYFDARFSARQFEMRVESVKDTDFLLGTLRADAIQGSGR